MRLLLLISPFLSFNLYAYSGNFLGSNTRLGYDIHKGFSGGIDMSGYAFGMGIILGILGVVIVISLVKRLLSPLQRGKWF